MMEMKMNKFEKAVYLGLRDFYVEMENYTISEYNKMMENDFSYSVVKDIATEYEKFGNLNNSKNSMNEVKFSSKRYSELFEVTCLIENNIRKYLND
jgi:hypothetical protein